MLSSRYLERHHKNRVLWPDIPLDEISIDAINADAPEHRTQRAIRVRITRLGIGFAHPGTPEKLGLITIVSGENASVTGVFANG